MSNAIDNVRRDLREMRNAVRYAVLSPQRFEVLLAKALGHLDEVEREMDGEPSPRPGRLVPAGGEWRPRVIDGDRP